MRPILVPDRVAATDGQRVATLRQCEFIDALIGRLRTGPPMSRADGYAVAMVATSLGMDLPNAGGEGA